MDLLLLFSGLFLALLGIAGSFLPVIPGPITSWLGLLLLHLTQWVPSDQFFLTITFSIAIAVFLLDYLIPILGTKRFGGTKNGMIGSAIGLVMGLLLMGPLGIVIGPFLGAFAGELLRDSQGKKKALKAAIGSLIGFLTGVFLKFSVALVYVFFFVEICFEHII